MHEKEKQLLDAEMNLFGIYYISISLSLPFPPFKIASRIWVIAVLNMNVRCDPRKYSLHWQHSPKDLSLRNPTIVSDGVDAE